MNTFEKEFQAYNLKLNIDRGTLITAHISDLHFPAMDPQRQYNILEDQFLKKIEAMPRLDLICVNGDLYDHKLMTSSDGTLYASMFVARLVEITKSHNATLILFLLNHILELHPRYLGRYL